MKYSCELICMIVNIFTVILIVHCEDENYFEDVTNPETFVDPHSFYYDKQSKKMIQETNAETLVSSVDEDNETEKEYINAKQVDSCNDHEAIFYKRLINLLLSNINIVVEDDVSVEGTLEIKVSRSQMEILQNFHDQKISLRKIDEIMSNGIRKPLHNHMFRVMHSFFDVLLKKFEMVLQMIQRHPDGAIIMFTMLVSYLIFRMIKWGHGFPMLIIIQFLFVISFFMCWWQLIQEAEIKALAEQMKFANIPISCHPDKMNLWDKFVSFVTSNEDCEKYYQVTMSNPKLKVTPAHALSHFITSVVLHPITHMGTIISHFISNATEDLPWLYGWSIRLMLFSCVGIVIIVIPFCLTGASINLGLGPLLNFGIGYRRKDRKDSSRNPGISDRRCIEN
ncbi:uncharacterized protein LOC143144684 isoform X2 [Ptiloglossa arizonensis]|uniref:uncharacterized protein LOC143144684 isoform X2 n=1 Tax=Ptiloglossa arizonensis TaxID=3350558 RepID=UPI003FA01976